MMKAGASAPSRFIHHFSAMSSMQKLSSLLRVLCAFAPSWPSSSSSAFIIHHSSFIIFFSSSGILAAISSA